MKWYVIYQDGVWGGIEGYDSDKYFYNSKKEALEALFESQLERRKYPDIKRIEKGCYKYCTSRQNDEEYREFLIVDEKQFKLHGYEMSR